MKRNFLIAYPGRWVWLNREWIPTKTVMAPVVADIEEVYMVGKLAEKTIIPPRSGKWVPVVAPASAEGKAVTVFPKKKYRDRVNLLFANSIDNVEEGVVLAWVVNTTEEEQEQNLFEELAEIAECDLLEEISKNYPVVDEESEGNFDFSGFTLPKTAEAEPIKKPPAIIREMNSPQGQLLNDELQKIKLKDEAEKLI